TSMIKDCMLNLEAILDSLPKGKEMADSKENVSERDRVMAHTTCLLQGVTPRNYTPLLKRVTCSTLDERIEYYRKKRKIAIVE
ncbi:jg13262, partial [Pararge aegeria aegeria]